MAWRKLWLCAGILAAGMSTCTIRAEVVDMGGFQIQIGQKSGVEMEPERKDTQQKQGQAQNTKREKVTEIPVENSGGISYEEWDTEPVQESQTGEASLEMQGAAQEVIQDFANLPGQSLQQEELFYTGTESTEQEYLFTEEESGTDGNTFLDENQGQGQAAGMQEETTGQAGKQADLEKDGAQSGAIQADNSEKGDDETAGRKTSSEKRKTLAGQSETDRGQRDSRQKVQFIHDESPRLKSGAVPSVQLAGQQEICVISYAVNHIECACRWEGDRLLPVEPVLKKGINCLEISVLSEDGQVIFMEPWYFSCGVGSAML
ncbi:MAG: hypothetical protein HFH57_14675 [Lachnospiraceae bacterium]|nr:hypothetical protein [Lachnospiraceae bacterium]